MTHLIIYHAGCYDGFTAAWVTERAVRDRGPVELVPCHYGQEPPDMRGTCVWVVDFSFPRPVLERMYEETMGVEPGSHHTARLLHPNCTGVPMPRKYTPSEREAAFWSKVNKDGPTQPHMATSCWVWAATSGRDRGSVAWNRVTNRPHRIAWILANGDIPDGLHVLHRCDNPPCVNPAHLFLGTHADNMADMVAKGRSCCGDSNGTHTRPDRRPIGARNGNRTHPESIPRGEARPHARLTDEKVCAIHAALARGVSKRHVASLFSVSRTTILRIARREDWKHVDST